MSDDEEYEYDYGSDGSYNYGSDAEANNEDGADEVIEIENSFYEADDLRTENPLQAIEKFQRVVELEKARGDQVKWRFKALQNLVTLNFGLGRNDETIKKYEEMLTYMASVTRNECTDAINTILDTIATATDFNALSKMYEMTLIALKSASNERMWFSTNLKLARVYLETGKMAEVERLILELKLSCQTADGTDDISKGSYLLEVYCLEIKLCALTRDSGRMRSIYPKTLNLNAAVADPRIMGTIREEGGKMHMAEENWDEAYNELYEAFRNYQEAGNSHARDCLKYVVLASMLALSDINPFAAREAKAFADDKEIVAMSELRQSLESNDLPTFEKVLRNKQNHIIDEPFLMTYIEPLRRRMREQVLINLTKPFRKVTMSHIAQELSLQPDDAESLVVDLILDGRLEGCIDQLRGHLILPSSLNEELSDQESRKYQSISRWADALNKVSENFDARFAL